MSTKLARQDLEEEYKYKVSKAKKKAKARRKKTEEIYSKKPDTTTSNQKTTKVKKGKFGDTDGSGVYSFDELKDLTSRGLNWLFSPKFKKKKKKKYESPKVYEAKKGGQVKSKGYSRGGQFKGTF